MRPVITGLGSLLLLLDVGIPIPDDCVFIMNHQADLAGTRTLLYPDALLAHMDEARLILTRAETDGRFHGRIPGAGYLLTLMRHVLTLTGQDMRPHMYADPMHTLYPAVVAAHLLHGAGYVVVGSPAWMEEHSDKGDTHE